MYVADIYSNVDVNICYERASDLNSVVIVCFFMDMMWISSNSERKPLEIQFGNLSERLLSGYQIIQNI